MATTRLPEEYCMKIRRALEGKMVKVIEKHRFPENVTIDGREARLRNSTIEAVEPEVLHKESRLLNGDFDLSLLPKIRIHGDRLLYTCHCSRRNGLQDDCKRLSCIGDSKDVLGKRESSYSLRSVSSTNRLEGNEAEERASSRRGSKCSLRRKSNQALGLINTFLERKPRRSNTDVGLPHDDESQKPPCGKVHKREQGDGTGNISPNRGNSIDRKEEGKLQEGRKYKDRVKKYGIFSGRLVVNCNCVRINGLQDFCNETTCSVRPRKKRGQRRPDKSLPPYFYEVAANKIENPRNERRTEREIDGPAIDRTGRESERNNLIVDSIEETRERGKGNTNDAGTENTHELGFQQAKHDANEKDGIVDLERNAPVELVKSFSNPNILEATNDVKYSDPRDKSAAEEVDNLQDKTHEHREGCTKEGPGDCLIPKNYTKVFVPSDWLPFQVQRPVIVEESSVENPVNIKQSTVDRPVIVQV